MSCMAVLRRTVDLRISAGRGGEIIEFMAVVLAVLHAAESPIKKNVRNCDYSTAVAFCSLILTVLLLHELADTNITFFFFPLVTCNLQLTFFFFLCLFVLQYSTYLSSNVQPTNKGLRRMQYTEGGQQGNAYRSLPTKRVLFP